MRVILHVEASCELEAVAEWYERQRPELGEELLAEANRAIGLISDGPETWPRWANAPRLDVRHFLLSRFPYRIIYLVRADHVLVVAFAHTSRDPGYWLGRAR